MRLPTIFVRTRGPRRPGRSARARSALLLATLPLAPLLLGACTSLSPDAGFGAVASTAQARLGKELSWARNESDLDTIERRVHELLGKPLDADAAVQIALLNNRGLQARFQDLGITEAEVVQAGRLPNPGFSFGRLKRGDEREIERGLHIDLARLAALPLVGRLETRRLDIVRGELAAAALALAAETRRAWIVAVAAGEAVRYRQQVAEAAEASAELARRMEQAGNFNKLARAREQGFHADAALGLARAEQHERAARERLTRLLGLWGAQTRFSLPERLPDLPPAPFDRPDVERFAMGQRLDVAAAKAAAEQTARQLGLVRTTRFINVLELGLVRNSSNEAPRQTGWEITLELPLFDWGDARVARAEALYMQALHRAAETAINARSEVREAYGHYRFAYDIARHHRDEIVPLARRVSEEQLLRYNGMLIGVFELLADARAQVAAVAAALDALRDFWLAQAELDAALLGNAALALPAAPAAAPAAAAAAPGGAPH